MSHFPDVVHVCEEGAGKRLPIIPLQAVFSSIVDVGNGRVGSGAFSNHLNKTGETIYIRPVVQLLYVGKSGIDKTSTMVWNLH